MSSSSFPWRSASAARHATGVRLCSVVALGVVLLSVLGLWACGEAPAELAAGPSLASLEPGARFWRPTCEIGLGASGAEEALIDGWARPEPDADWRWSTGLRSDLWLDALGGEPLRLGFEAWAFDRAARDGAQSVEVSVGGRSLGTVELTLESAVSSVDVPAGLLEPGRNRIALSYASSAPAPGDDPRVLSAGWRRIWLEAPAAPLPGWLASCAGAPAIPGGFEDDSLLLPLGSGVDLFFDAPGERWLLVDELVLEDAGGRAGPEPASGPESASGSPARLVVVVERAAGGELGPTRVGSELGAGERDFRLELPPGDGPVRITLVARSAGDAQAAGPADSRRPVRLRVVGGRLARPSTPAGSPPETGSAEVESPTAGPRSESRGASTRPGPPPNVVIYLVDTLRADHLGCYGYPRATSPRLDAFAREGVLFERAVAQSSWTRPAAATVLTGLDPRVHGVHGRSDRLPDEIVTLPERLQSMGYETAAVITNGNVSAAFGFNQGFDEFTYLAERARRDRRWLSHRVTEIAGAWLEARVERGEPRPFFLYLHTADPHAPYSPEPSFRRRFLEREPAPRAGSLPHLRALEQGDLAADADTVADLIALYDAEIAFNDHSFGLLLDRLEALDLARDTLVVFLSDHGEEFADHGGWQHGRTLYQEQLHVPLVLRLPAAALAGERRSELVQQTDVVPTILEVVGAPAAPGLQGRPLVRRAAGAPELLPAVARHPAFAVLDLDGAVGEASFDRDHKLVRRAGGASMRPPQVELFDLSRDPAERLDLAAAEPVRLGYLEALLRSRGVLWPVGVPAELAAIDEELAAELRALGYVQ
jgi:arylsulfatase A-like enzyme